MTKINFKEFAIPLNIRNTDFKVVDVREEFADIIFRNAAGARAYDVMQRIFKSEGEIEFSDEDIAIIKATADKFCVVAFIDALNIIINKKK